MSFRDGEKERQREKIRDLDREIQGDRITSYNLRLCINPSLIINGVKIMFICSQLCGVAFQ